MDVIRNSEFMKGVARKRGLDLDTVALTPESLLLKMWVVIQELMAQAARRTGARFIATPPQTRGADGFLAEPYVRAGDLTHANEDYGRLMMGLALHV